MKGTAMLNKLRNAAAYAALAYAVYVSAKGVDDVLHLIAQELGVSEHPDYQW